MEFYKKSTIMFYLFIEEINLESNQSGPCVIFYWKAQQNSIRLPVVGHLEELWGTICKGSFHTRRVHWLYKCLVLYAMHKLLYESL